MRHILRFHHGLLRSPVQVKIWLGVLLAANMIAPLFFLGSVEAKLVLAALGASVIIMTVLTAMTGFTRLLGLGHVPWVPLVLWLLTRLEQLPAETPIGAWIRVLILLNSVSLILDAVDVARYARGERQEMASGLPAR